jgi:hypothetical protein
MDIGMILAILLVLGYVILYIRGRYYMRENYEELEEEGFVDPEEEEGFEDIEEDFEDDDAVDVIGSGN